jgi:hypothetical protein
LLTTKDQHLSAKTGDNRTGQDAAQHRFANFKTGALNHSATLPSQRHQSLSARKIKNSLAMAPKLDPSALWGFKPSLISTQRRLFSLAVSRVLLHYCTGPSRGGSEPRFMKRLTPVWEMPS